METIDLAHGKCVGLNVTLQDGALAALKMGEKDFIGPLRKSLCPCPQSRHTFTVLE